MGHHNLVFLGSLHPKEPPKIESGQKIILELEIWPGSKVDIFSDGEKNREILKSCPNFKIKNILQKQLKIDDSCCE